MSYMVTFTTPEPVNTFHVRALGATKEATPVEIEAAARRTLEVMLDGVLLQDGYLDKDGPLPWYVGDRDQWTMLAYDWEDDGN